MSMTIGEKIIARAAGVESVKPGEIHTIDVDYLMSNDGTTHLTIDMFYNQLKNPRIADKDKLVFIIDHNIPAENPKTAAAHKKMREFAKKYDIAFYEGKGVCHHAGRFCGAGAVYHGGGFPYLFLRGGRRFRHGNRLYGLFICYGDRKIMGTGAGDDTV